MLIITQTALELGFLYALVAMALFLSYRILDIADLTTDGCFVLGAAVSVTVTAAGHPVLAIFAAMLAGACAGFVTAILQTKLGVPSIVLALIGAHFGTSLQLMIEEKYLQYLLLIVLPVVAFITLRTHKWPDEPEPLDSKLRKLIVWAAAFIIGGYDGYYGPGTGTFLMIIFVRFAKLDTRHAAGGVKVINLASNFGSLFTALRAGYVLVGVGLISAVASILGHYLGAGLAIKNGSKIVKPTVILVLLLLMVKVGSELLFPEFWN